MNRSLSLAQRKEWRKMHESKKQALLDFNEAKLGLFIHWGAYSNPAGIWKGKKIPGLGEWIMFNAEITRKEYKALCRDFNPVDFDAEKWVLFAKKAGMKYVVAMPKHHDGFAMYDSKVTGYNVVDMTSFGRDPMKEIYESCQKHNIRFAIYYSHATDWMDGGDAGVSDYMKKNPKRKRTWPANTWDPSPVDYKKYLEKKAKPQIKELLKNFPDMQEIWFDVPQWMTREQSFDFYKLVYDIQPNCLVSSRIGNNFGDFWTPGDNKIPSGNTSKGLYWETPGTLNNTWGFKSYDTDWKSEIELIYWITEITSKGGNYLLNVGPTAAGIFPEESIMQLKAIGGWMKINGEAVYGTGKWLVNHEGPTRLNIKGTRNRETKGFDAKFTSSDFWFSAKNNAIYITSLKWPEKDQVLIKSLKRLSMVEKNKVTSVKMLGCSKKLQWEMCKDGLFVSLPSTKPNPFGYVLKIVF